MSVDVQTGPDFHSGTPRALFKIPKNNLAATATSDLRRYLWALPADENAGNPIEVVLNWPAAIAKP
jgi:hypothetical protein